MSIFAIGDLHLSFHEEVDKPMEVFGPRWESHVERLEEAWRDLISVEDTIILAGDISWGLKLEEAIPDLEWIDAMPGRKVIIKGNHDLWWKGITKLNQMYESITFLQNDCYLAEDYFICGSRGWICPGDRDFTAADEKIFNREILRLERSILAAKNRGDNKIIMVTHFPPTNDRLQSSLMTEMFEKVGIWKAIYGHLHGEEAFGKGLKGMRGGVEYQLVSLDYLNCVPLRITED